MLDRYGVDALRLELSRQLTEVIKQELPAMKATLLKERKLVSTADLTSMLVDRAQKSS